MDSIFNVNANQNSYMTCVVASFQRYIAIPSRKHQNILKWKKQKNKTNQNQPNKQNIQNKQIKPKLKYFNHL